VRAEKKNRLPNRWSVLIIDDVGRTISFYLSKRAGFAVVASLSVLVILCVYFAVSFFLMLRENAALRKDSQLVTAELHRAKSDAEKALVQLMLLKESTNPAAGKPVTTPVRESEDLGRPEEGAFSDQFAEAGMGASEASEPSASAHEPSSAAEETGSVPDSQSTLVVDKLEMWPDPGSHIVRYRYVVKNANQEGGKVSGYTFLVLAAGENSAAVPPRVFPDTRLAEGKPGDFRRGLYFSIARYKPVEGTLANIDVIARYETATIYAYSDTGDLLTKRVFEIGNVLRT
jgi:hypothetical protein